MSFAEYTAKPKPCAQCHRDFLPVRPLQQVCSPVCASRKVRTEKAKEREAVKARRRALETIPELIKLAQRAFNEFIRERDKHQTCICCGQHLGTGEVGGAFDCGHYRSVGSASHLRFDERNANGQRKVCNRYGAGRAVDYRIGLIARIGLAEVEALEADNGVKKWDRDELRAIAATYRQKTKELRSNQA